jgi:hypothetical protein
VTLALKRAVFEHSTFSRSGDSQNAFEETRAEQILPNYEYFDISVTIRPLGVSTHGSWFLEIFNNDVEINTGFFCIAIRPLGVSTHGNWFLEIFDRF